MYFSVISPQEGELRQAAHEFVGAAYAEHQWLWRFFPSSADQSRDFIFVRHETQELPRFYVVSQRHPLVTAANGWLVKTKDYQPQLEVGQQFSFELRANPVVTVKNAIGKSERHDIVMRAKKILLAKHSLTHWAQLSDVEKPMLYELVNDECCTWLKKRAEQHGFKVQELEVSSYLQHRAGKKDIRFSTVDFTGVLEVTHPELFQQVLFNGLGHAKAFGCGLLLIKRV